MKNNLFSNPAGFNDDESLLIAQIFKEESKKLFHLSLKITDNDAQSQDIVANAFEYILKGKKKEGFQNRRKLKEFLYGFTRNRSINYLRDRNNQQKKWDMIDWPEEIQDQAADRHFIEAETKRQLALYLEKLPPRCQQVIRKRYIEEMTKEEVAATLGISVHTVRNQELKGLRLLKGTVPPRDGWEILFTFLLILMNLKK
jgi:RNA polymerase sigma factor (sigma-70 family)